MTVKRRPKGLEVVPRATRRRAAKSGVRVFVTPSPPRATPNYRNFSGTRFVLALDTLKRVCVLECPPLGRPFLIKLVLVKKKYLANTARCGVGRAARRGACGLLSVPARDMQLACAALLLPLVNAITVKVSDGYVLNTVPAGFASFTMDYHPGSQGAVWGSNASILEVDLSGAGIIGVARALAPGVLRLGGSEAGENLTYVGFPGSVVQCPPDYYYCLTRKRWDAIHAFTSTTGVRLMFDLNLIGPGHSENWTAALAQIDALLAYTATQHSAPWAFELGNENNVNNKLAPSIAAARFAQVHGLLTRYWPQRVARPLLVGPSVHIDRDWIVGFLRALARGRSGAGDGLPIDAFAYHMYAGYGLAPDIAAQVPTAAFLDDARGLVDEAAAAVRFSAAGTAAALPLIVSETAAAWASGGPSGACVGFASSFWCPASYLHPTRRTPHAAPPHPRTPHPAPSRPPALPIRRLLPTLRPHPSQGTLTTWCTRPRPLGVATYWSPGRRSSGATIRWSTPTTAMGLTPTTLWRFCGVQSSRVAAAVAREAATRPTARQMNTRRRGCCSRRGLR